MNQVSAVGLRVVLVLCVATYGAGCGPASTDEPSAPVVTAPSKTFCETDDSAPPFTQGWTESGPDGYSFALAEATPVSPVMGKNTWTIHVKDPQGADVNDADVSLTCSMPAHGGLTGHGCQVEPEVTNLGNGLYRFEPVIFYMQKHWDVTVKATLGTVTDAAVFPICVP